jgi:hypothetical protein
MRSTWFLPLVLIAAPLSAQSADSVLAPLVPKSKLVRFSVGDAYITGRLIALTSGVATLATETGNQTATLASIDAIWVRGHATKTGAIVGGVAGAILFGAFVGYAVNGLCEVDCDNSFLEGALVGGAIGLGGGALLGAGIGALIPKWRLRFP